MITQEERPMATIRPAAAHDLARIEEIYDTIHTAEEAGKSASAGCAACTPRARPRRPGWMPGICSCSPTAAPSMPPGASTASRCRCMPRCRGRMTCRRSPGARAAHARRRPGGGRAWLRDAVRALLRAARPRARLPGAAHRHEREKRQRPAGSTPISATARPGSRRARSTASTAWRSCVWKSGWAQSRNGRHIS